MDYTASVFQIQEKKAVKVKFTPHDLLVLRPCLVLTCRFTLHVFSYHRSYSREQKRHKMCRLS